MKSLLPITIRLKLPTDKDFIYSSWIKNMWSAKPYSFIQWSLFCNHQAKLIDQLDSVSNTLVACLAEDPDILLGYLTYSLFNNKLIIHYGNVKQAYRNNHIMDDLISTVDPNWRQLLIPVTNISKTYDSLSNKFKLTYDPYVINLLLQIKEQDV